MPTAPCPCRTTQRSGQSRTDCLRLWRIDGGLILLVLRRGRFTYPGTDARTAAHGARMRTTYVLHLWRLTRSRWRRLQRRRRGGARREADGLALLL